MEGGGWRMGGEKQWVGEGWVEDSRWVMGGEMIVF